MIHIHTRLKTLYDARSRDRAGRPSGLLVFTPPPIFNGLSAVLLLALRREI
jgi:hypothetical protein